MTKITELKCPQCGANLDIDDPDLETIHCRYCGHDFLLDLEEEKEDAPRFERPPMPAKKPASKKKGSPLLGIIITVSIISCLIPLVLLFVHFGELDVALPGSATEQSGPPPRSQPQSELMLRFVGQVFDKTASLVTPQELASIKYLKLEYFSTSDDYTVNGYHFTYSLEDPYLTPTTVLQSAFLSTKQGENQVVWQDFQCFTGLTVLDLGGLRQDIWDDEREQSNDGFNLANLTALRAYHGSYYQTLTDLTFANPAKIEDLAIRVRGEEDLERLAAFTNLTSFSCDYFNSGFDFRKLAECLPKVQKLTLERVEDLSWLSALTNLQHLQIDAWSVKDFATLYGLPGLVSLHLEDATHLKDLGFVANMPNLQELYVERSAIISLEPLRDKISLLSLRLKNNDEIKDLTPITTLTSLRHLVVDDYGDAVMPDLSALTHLLSADLRHMHIPALSNAASLTSLTWRGGNFSASRLVGMINLQELTVLNGSLLDPAGLEQLPQLRSLVLYGSAHSDYSDWSMIFNLPQVERLVVGANHLPFNQESIQENHVLKELYIDALRFQPYPELYSGGLFFHEFTGAIAKMKGLEEFSLQRAELQSLDFLAGLSNLRLVDISHNYVTDIGPLAALPHLEELYCGDNPIQNLSLLPARVAVYMHPQPGLRDYEN